jgi:lysyl-tRNA synthetase class 2
VVETVPAPVRRALPPAWAPRLAGGLTALAGAANVAAALQPDLRGRLALVAGSVPHGVVLAAHAAVLPGGAALVVLGAFLARRRRRALWLAVGLLLALGVLELLRGLELEEATLSWAVAGLLAHNREAFPARSPVAGLLGSLRRIGVAAGVAAGTAALAVAVGAARTGGAPAGVQAHEVVALLALQPGPMDFGEALRWLPAGVGFLSLGVLAFAAWTLFRPLRPREDAPAPEGLRAVCRALVRAHGDDTLSAFKLRADVAVLASRDGRAFLAYRVESGVLLVAGDPVGPPDAIPALLADACAFAAARGLRFGALGATERFADVARAAGLSAFYVGDEAILGTAGLTLEGRAMKKVRQAVRRVEREGVVVAVRPVGSLDAGELAELERVSTRWRGGAAEIGFAMAIDSLGAVPDSVVVVARDGGGEGAVRGYLHFVPVYGRPAMSLSTMRRDRDAPNGLTELLVVRGAEALRAAHGVEELSLNFAGFARWQHSPAGRIERALARVVRRATFLQFDSLYRFNAKFAPRWQPRYLLHEGPAALPRTALAAMWAEGQVPRPALPRRRAAARDVLA